MASNVSWMSKAACKDSGVNMYPGAGAAGKKQAGEAIKVCSGCSVRGACLSYAMENMHSPGVDEMGRESKGLFVGPGAFGVWGGVPEGRRREMAKEAEGPRGSNLNQEQFPTNSEE